MSVRLAVAVAGPPAAWAFQLVVGYGLEEIACSSGTAGDDYWGVAPGTLQWAIAAAALGVDLAAGLLAFRVLRAAGADPRGRIAFMARCGLLASALFLALILFGALQLAALDSCVPG
jgi:hypothetical protein